jgi:hypothetical protein
VNKQELRRAVRDRNGIPDTGDGLAGHTDIDAAVAAALLDLSAEKEWPWLLASHAITAFSTTTGEPTTALPSYSAIHKLVVNGRPARHASLQDFLDSTVPFVWTEIGNTVRLDPIPTTATTGVLWYWQTEPALETDDAVPLLPTVFHQTLVARASYHLNVRRGRNTEIARDLSEYERGVPNIMRAAERFAGPRRVRDAYAPKGQTARWS